MIEGIKLVPMPTVFGDLRGHYHELFNRRALVEHGISDEFVQFSVSVSKQNVLRGIHGDMGTTKLIACLAGEIQWAFVDNRPDSPTYLSAMHGRLDETSSHCIYVPKGIGNSYLTLSNRSVYFYAQTTYYGEFKQFTLQWNDPRFAIPWLVERPILSARDGG